MSISPYPHPLPVTEFLEQDMRRHLEGEGWGRRAAALDFAVLCYGNSASGTGPDYARTSRTVWRVENDGVPPPQVSVFEWGGHYRDVPMLRVWFVESATMPPAGIGAFDIGATAVVDDGYPERPQIESRLGTILGAAGLGGAGWWLARG